MVSAGWAPSDAERELLGASLLAAGVHWRFRVSFVSRSTSLMSTFIVNIALIRVCVQISPFCKDSSRTGLETLLLQHDLILINYICNDPISN